MLLRYVRMKALTKTDTIAAIGRANKTPIKPKRLPPASKAKIIQTGWTPMRSPTSLGVKNVASEIWPVA